MSDQEHIETITDKVKPWRSRPSLFDPTPAAQAWLDAHPDEAQKAEGYEPVTFIPFQRSHYRADEERTRLGTAQGRANDR